MLSLSNPLCARIAALPVLSGWDVRTDIEHSNRQPVPAVDVRCEEARVTSARMSGLLLSPMWRITLAVKRSDAAVTTLDAALSGVIESLHNWMPGTHGGRSWEPLQLVQVVHQPFQDAAVVGYELMFSTGAKYVGQP